MTSSSSYVTSLEALRHGLLTKDDVACEATVTLLARAHHHSRSQVVLLVADLPHHLRTWVLERWFGGDWFVQRAAWWVAGWLERVDDESVTELAQRFRLFHRLVGAQESAVRVQGLVWLYSRVQAGRVPALGVDTPFAQTLMAWLDEDDVPLALATLQVLMEMQIAVSPAISRSVVRRGVENGIREADFLGVRLGSTECALRLVEEIRRNGPYAVRAVGTLSQNVVPDALASLKALFASRLWNDDARIHVATVLAAHGSPEAWELLVAYGQDKDPRKQAMSYSSRVKALEARGSERAHVELWKEVLRQPEALRAWVLSRLNPAVPMHRQWLEQAQAYGTDEEKLAVDDAFQTHFGLDN